MRETKVRLRYCSIKFEIAKQANTVTNQRITLIHANSISWTPSNFFPTSPPPFVQLIIIPIWTSVAIFTSLPAFSFGPLQSILHTLSIVIPVEGP